MQVSALPKRLVAIGKAGNRRLVVRPSESAAFAELGLTSPEEFLALRGEVVCGHPDRHVMRVQLGDGRFAYLKREHRTRWKVRFRNWRAKFGLISKSVREGRVLQLVEERKLPGPRWLAFGETRDGRAFLLLEEAGAVIDLRQAWPDVDSPESMAIKLGRLCGEIHAAGIDHPDLYSKHFMIDRSTMAVTLLDWQRVRLYRQVPWSHRVHALATLVATLPAFEAGADNGLNNLFLWAYLRAGNDVNAPAVSTLSQWVERECVRLSRNDYVRRQQKAPINQSRQRLVWLEGEALCAIPEVASELDPPRMRALLYDPERHANLLSIAGGTARLEVGVHDSLWGRCWAWLRLKAWRSAQLRKARLLFHLERHQVPAPKLLAYGQRCRGIKAKAFVLAATVNATPLSITLRQADPNARLLLLQRLADALRRLHDAGCEARTKKAFAVKMVDGMPAITIANPDRLIFHKRLNERRKKSDWKRVARSMLNDCNRDEIDGFVVAQASSLVRTARTAG